MCSLRPPCYCTSAGGRDAVEIAASQGGLAVIQQEVVARARTIGGKCDSGVGAGAGNAGAEKSQAIRRVVHHSDGSSSVASSVMAETLDWTLANIIMPNNVSIIAMPP